MTPIPQQRPCSTCGETTEFDALPVDDGFDPDERLCLRCGLALWVLTPLEAVGGAA
jgi:heterodisulfide reductase subunit A-like polyferredoxin